MSEKAISWNDNRDVSGTKPSTGLTLRDIYPDIAKAPTQMSDASGNNGFVEMPFAKPKQTVVPAEQAKFDEATLEQSRRLLENPSRLADILHYRFDQIDVDRNGSVDNREIGLAGGSSALTNEERGILPILSKLGSRHDGFGDASRRFVRDFYTGQSQSRIDEQSWLDALPWTISAGIGLAVGTRGSIPGLALTAIIGYCAQTYIASTWRDEYARRKYEAENLVDRLKEELK